MKAARRWWLLPLPHRGRSDFLVLFTTGYGRLRRPHPWLHPCAPLGRKGRSGQIMAMDFMLHAAWRGEATSRHPAARRPLTVDHYRFAAEEEEAAPRGAVAAGEWRCILPSRWQTTSRQRSS